MARRTTRTPTLPTPHTPDDAAPHAADADAGDDEEEVQFFFAQTDADPAPASASAPAEDSYVPPTSEPPVDDYEEPAPFTDDYVFEPGAETEQPLVAPPVHAPAPAQPAQPAPVRTYRAADDPDEDIHAVIADGVREIAGEVRNSLDFQRIQGGGEAVQGIVLSGPVLDVPGFAEGLERELGLPLHRASIEAPTGALGGLVTSSRLAVAVGLSIEEVAP